MEAKHHACNSIVIALTHDVWLSRLFKWLHRRIVYHKMQLVFQMFEDGSLKVQKKREMTAITLQKALQGKLPPKLSQGLKGTGILNVYHI